MPPLPNAVATPSAPIIGGAVKQEALKKPLSLLVTDPLVTSWPALQPETFARS
jgi:hypothetical protein